VLSSNGIVGRHSHHSIKVSEMDPDRLRRLFHVRRLIEEEAISLCIDRVDAALIDNLRVINGELEAMITAPRPERINALDRAFHTAIFATCGNDALVWTIDRVKSSFPMYALWREPGRLAVSVNEHKTLIDRLAAHDRDGAVAAQRAHLDGGLEATIAFLALLDTP